jgi:membrane-associated protease RseP (regulator of RpoE activity)
MTTTLIIISLVALILIHELGHLIAAKAVGVKVTRFSIGFGPALIKKQYGETEYVFAPVLLGGYVRLLGDDPTAEVPESEKNRAYGEQPIWKRLAIVVSGVMANLIVAVVVLFFIKLTIAIKNIETSYIYGDFGVYRYMYVIGQTIFSCLVDSVVSVAGMATKILSVLWGIITGAVSVKTLGGPIAVFSIAGSKLQTGLLSFLSFMVIISVNLAVFNLLPIPVLDGGHVVLLAVESITKRQPGLKPLMIWNGIGIGVVTLLMVAVFVNDFLRYFAK